MRSLTVKIMKRSSIAYFCVIEKSSISRSEKR